MAIVVMVFEIAFYSKYLLPAYVVGGGAWYLAMLRFLKAVRQEDIDLIRHYFGWKLRFANDVLRILLSPGGK
jgi:hypothetical protein